MIFAGIFPRDDFFKNRHGSQNSPITATSTSSGRSLCCRCQSSRMKQTISSRRESHARVHIFVRRKFFTQACKRTKLQIVHAGFNQRVDSFFQKIEKRQLVSGPCFMRNFEQRNRDRRRRRLEVGNDFLVTNRFQNVAHRLLKAG